MKVDELLAKAKDGLETKMVYGEPYEVDGVTVIVASSVGTGGGGGDSRDAKGRSGEGGGFGLMLLRTLPDRWGISASGPTCVWFEIDSGL